MSLVIEKERKGVTFELVNFTRHRIGYIIKFITMIMIIYFLSIVNNNINKTDDVITAFVKDLFFISIATWNKT